MKQPRPHLSRGYQLSFASLTMLLVVGCFSVRYAGRSHSHGASLSAKTRPTNAELLAAYGRLPIAFEENLGQSNSEVRFLARGHGYALFLTETEAVFRLRAEVGSATAGGQGARESVIRISMPGSNSEPQVQEEELQPGKTNYLVGNDPSRWHRGVPSYGRVKYHDVYPGIDAEYYGNQNQLETDFVVAAGSNPAAIQLHIEGAKALQFGSRGDLVIATPSGDLTLRRPDAYQDLNGVRREVAANFSLQGPSSLGIEVGPYDSTQALVIDPVVVYSTYLGGANGGLSLAINTATAIAVDSNDDAYVLGSTDTLDFPTTSGALQTQNTTNETYAFITKFNSTGTGLIYSTLLGGSKGAGGAGIAIDSSGDAYVTGGTVSTDFPVTNSAIQSVFPAGNLEGTVYFAELDPNGATLLYSTYLGGNGYSDVPAGIALDANDDAYITGYTSSTNFPVTPTALQLTNNSGGALSVGGNNVFLSRIDPTKVGLNSLIYSTYLGGSGTDEGTAIAVDANQNAYLTGSAGSSNFPLTANAFQSNWIGPSTDTFVARVDTVNSILVYSTFLGGGASHPDTGNCIAVDSNANAYVGGMTYDTEFPTTAGAFETTFPGAAGIFTGFVAKFDTAAATSGASLVWATYLGGTISGDQPHALQIDSQDNVYLAGETWSGELLTGGYPASLGAPYTNGVAGLQNGFVTVLTADGSNVAFSTYYGIGVEGSNANNIYGLALDNSSPPNVFIAGETRSTSFPITTGSYQTTLNGLISAFAAELSPAAAQGVFATPSSLTFGNQAKGTTSPSQAVTLTNATPNSLTNIAITITGANASDFAQTNTCPTAPPTLSSAATCTINVTFTPSTTSNESATLNVADSASSSPQTVALTGTGTVPPPGVTLSPTSLNFGTFTQGTASSAQTFTLSNNSAAAITITSPGITVTGSNAGDFAIQSTSTCPAVNGTLAASTTCIINIIFTPSTTSSESATLSVSDTDSSSPQTASLSGTGTAPSGAVTLAPSTLSFGNVNLNTTSPAQTATLSNTKTTTLTITSVTFTGPNATDFAQSNTCGTSLAATTGTCTISIKFTPTTTAAESAMLTVTDSDSTSPQTVALSGTGVATGPDFTISATPSSATVGTHGTITTMVTVNSVDGFISPVMLNGVSLPGDSSIAFTQNPLTPAANGSVSTLVTITTSSGVFSSTPISWPRIPSMPALLAALGILGLAAFAMSKLSGRNARKIVSVFALLSIVALASCTGTPSTPTGTYTVRLTGTAGASTHAFSFTLVVK